MNVLSPSMPLYGTLSLFRTSFAGCYVFPCASLGCDVSTCKPYGYLSVKGETGSVKGETKSTNFWQGKVLKLIANCANFWQVKV